MFVIRQQSATDRGEYTRITIRTVATLAEARSLVYETYGRGKASSHYAVISEGGRFVRTIKFGTMLDGFRNPTNVERLSG